MGGYLAGTPQAGTPLWAGTPRGQVHPPGHSACWDTVNKWAVCIPLECIFVVYTYVDLKKAGLPCWPSKGMQVRKSANKGSTLALKAGPKSKVGAQQKGIMSSNKFLIKSFENNLITRLFNLNVFEMCEVQESKTHQEGYFLLLDMLTFL